MISMSISLLCGKYVQIDSKDHSGPYLEASLYKSQGKQVTIHHITTMLATSKNVVFPGHNHLLTTGTDDPIL